MKTVVLIVAGAIVLYIVYRFRAIEEKLTSFKRSMDVRLTSHDIDSIIQVSHKQTSEALMAYVDSRIEEIHGTVMLVSANEYHEKLETDTTPSIEIVEDEIVEDD